MQGYIGELGRAFSSNERTPKSTEKPLSTSYVDHLLLAGCTAEKRLSDSGKWVVQIICVSNDPAQKHIMEAAETNLYKLTLAVRLKWPMS